MEAEEVDAWCRKVMEKMEEKKRCDLDVEEEKGRQEMAKEK